MIKTKWLKSIFTIVLLFVFVSTPLIAEAKPGKSQGKGKPEIVSKQDKNDKQQAKNDENRQKKDDKRIDKQEKRVEELSKKLDSIDLSLVKVTGIINEFLGVPVTEAEPTTGSAVEAETTEPSDTEAETTTESAVTTQTAESSETAETETTIEPAAGSTQTPESGVTTETAVTTEESTTTESAVEVEEDSDDEAVVGEDEEEDEELEEENEKPSKTGFINGNMGKLRALLNRLQAAKKQVRKLSSEDAVVVTERIEEMEARATELYERLKLFILEPVPTAEEPAENTEEAVVTQQ